MLAPPISAATMRQPRGSTRCWRTKGTKQDFKEAQKWFRRAAALGFPGAQYGLAEIHFRGLGVEQDLLEAARWYGRAAEQGHVQAQFTLAVLYQIGAGVRKNRQKSAYWFERAASQGHAEAQSQLGNMYEAGRAVPRDQVIAYKWLALAQSNARSMKVRTNAAKSLERVAARMTPAQIGEGRRLAREWRAMRSKVRQP